jgi:hypothetical protein
MDGGAVADDVAHGEGRRELERLRRRRPRGRQQRRRIRFSGKRSPAFESFEPAIRCASIVKVARTDQPVFNAISFNRGLKTT